MKKLFLAALALAVPCFAQTTTITATKIHQGATTLLPVGYLCLTPVNSAGQPTAFSVNGGGQYGAQPNCIPVNNGTLAAGSVIPDTAYTTPAIGYQAQVEDSFNNVLSTFIQPIYPTGTTWSVDTWAPTLSVTVPANVLAQYSTPPQTRCQSPSLATSGASLYTCLNQVWTLVSGPGNGTPISHLGSTSTYATVNGNFQPGDAIITDSLLNLIDAGGPPCLLSACGFTMLPTLPTGTPTGQQAVSNAYLQAQLSPLSSGISTAESAAAAAQATANAALPKAGGTMTGPLGFAGSGSPTVNSSVPVLFPGGVSGLPLPVNQSDAVTLAYLNSALSGVSGVGGLTGQTANYLPKSASPTTSTSSSSIEETGTVVRHHEPVVNLAGETNSGFLENAGRIIYDPMNPAYKGGLAGAVAGISGFTPTQVLQATVDFAECQYQMGIVSSPAFEIIVPGNLGAINVGGVKFWSYADFHGNTYSTGPPFQHNDSSQPMFTGHNGGDTLTCFNGTTYSPARADFVDIHNIYIAGMGPVNTDTDQGIRVSGYNWNTHDVGGFGQGFGAQAFLDAGFNSIAKDIGDNHGAQLKGCMSYTSGTRAVSNAQGGVCYAVESGAVDAINENFYATDGTQGGNGQPNAIPACYPKCGAIGLLGDNSQDTNMFAQKSAMGIVFNGLGKKGNTFRSDATDGLGFYFAPGGFIPAGTIGSNNGAQEDVYSSFVVASACTSTALNVASPTGCAGIVNAGMGNTITGYQNADAAGQFGPSYYECQVNDQGTGGSAAPNQYAQVAYNPSLTNAGPNNLKWCGYFDASYASGKVLETPGQAIFTNGLTTANVSGVTSININGSSPVTSFYWGVPGQTLIIQGTGGVTTGGNIYPCSGATTIPRANTVLVLTETGPYNANVWSMNCGG